MSFITWGKGKKTSSYLWIQSCNLKIPLLAHYTNYLSSFSALFQLNYLLFPSGLLLFSASLAANELRYRTACLLSLFFPNIYRGGRAGGLRRITGGIKLDNIQLDTHRFNCAYRKIFGESENYLDSLKLQRSICFPPQWIFFYTEM